MDIQKRKTELGRLRKKKKRNLDRRKARYQKRNLWSKQVSCSSFTPDIMTQQDQLFWSNWNHSVDQRKKSHMHTLIQNSTSLVTPPITYASALVRDMCQTQDTPTDNVFDEAEYDITRDVCALHEDEYYIVTRDELMGEL